MIDKNTNKKTPGNEVQLCCSLSPRVLENSPSFSKVFSCIQREEKRNVILCHLVYATRIQQYFLSSYYDYCPTFFAFLLLLLLRIGLLAQLCYFEGGMKFTPDTFKIFYFSLGFCSFAKLFQVLLIHPILDLLDPVTCK